jgi:uncharacterized protein
MNRTNARFPAREQLEESKMSNSDQERENIDRVRRGFEAFATGDMATLSELFEERALWHEEPTGVLTGDYHGRDAILGFFGQLHQETAGTLRVTPATMAASGDKVFVQVEASGERAGRSLRARQVLVFTLGGGRVREVQMFTADFLATQAFWS